MDYEKAYKEALERAKKLTSDMTTLQKIREFIFPQLRESEDERIRKVLVELVEAQPTKEFIGDVSKDDCLAYLEKQKGQKPVGDGTREKIISRATSEKQVVLVSESDGNAEIGWDTRSLEDAKNLLEYGISFIYKQLGIKPAEWDEGDKTMLAKVEQIVLKHWNSLSDSFYHKYDDENQDAESCYNWLKSLHGRFGLQPKHEWSEEDEEMRNLIITIFEVNHPDGFFKANELGTTDMRGVHTEEIISWLKSLRPQCRHSEEQMKNFPKWKRADRDWDAGTIDFAVFHKNDGGDHEDWLSVEVTNRLYKGEYYIELSDLDKLPKEE